MTLNELYALTNWIELEISDKQVPQNYQALHSILSQNAQPNQPKQPFEQQKESLIKSINSVPLNKLTHGQIELLHSLGIAQFICEEGVAHIEEVLFKNSLDIATAVTKIAEINQSISNGISKAGQIHTGLEGCVEKIEPEIEQVLMRVHFSGHASMENIISFKDWGNTWFEIGRGIAMATGGAPEEIKIVAANKGSIVFDLAVTYGIAEVASKVVLKGLEIVERALKIRAEVENIRHLRLQNKKIAQELDAELQQEKQAGIDKAIEEIVKELDLNKGNQGDKKEAVSKAITKLIDFIEKGGEVDFVMPEESDDEKANAKGENVKVVRMLQKNIEQVRRLENTIRAIGHDHNS